MPTPHNTSLALLLPILCSGLANILLGTSSLYWKALGDIPPITLVSYRVVLSAITLSAFILLCRNTHAIKHLPPKLIRLHCMASLFIAINWGAFIWSSINGHILESGLGYLLAPFISIALGAIIYNESISRTRALSTLAAFTGVALLIAFTPHLNHWVYLTIALSWGAYTHLKKSTVLDAVNGLCVETLFLTVCMALAISLLKLPIMAPNEFSAGPNQLIWLAGGVSAIPLLMFSYATGKIPLSITGFLQFTLPLTLIAISVVT